MKILVLAGGADQIALIVELRKRGHTTILVDYFDNPPAKKYADKHFVASTLDFEVVKKIAEAEKIDLITTACTDQALLTMAKVSEELNLPCYLSYQKSLNVTNKSYMKHVLADNNIPTAKFAILSQVNMDSIRDFEFPLVVKPVDCNSSKGVKRVDVIEDFSNDLNEAIQCSRTKTAIVEEYKTGKEISADYYVEGHKVKLLCATTSLKIKNKKSFTILCSDYPAVDDNQEIVLTKIGQQIADAFDLSDCPLFIQLIVNNLDMYVIEFSARMGGGSKYHLIKVLSGVNIMSAYTDRILGEKPIVTPTKQVSFCKMVYLYCNPGIFDHVEGLSQLKERGIIAEYFVYKTKGMHITKAETSSDRAASFLITANSAEELYEKYKYVDSQISIISNEGIDMMIHKLLI